MPSNPRSFSTLSDERRLFPAIYKRPNPNEVRITPGLTFNRPKNPLLRGSFQPIDTISRNAKESGPVRAGGKAQDRSHSERNGFRQSDLRSGSGVSVEIPESPRPAKRIRREEPAPATGIIDLEEEHNSEVISTSRPNSLFISPYFQSFTKRKKTRDRENVPSLPNEYLQIERDINSYRHQNASRTSKKPRCASIEDEENDVLFTEIAAKQRRSQASDSGISREIFVDSNEFVSTEAVDGVEVVIPRDCSHARHTRVRESPPLQARFVGANGKHRTSNMRESPDELQGEATVPPATIPLSRRREACESQMKDVTVRARSPSADIPLTLFTSSSEKIHGKPRKRNVSSEKVPRRKETFDATLFRFGSLDLVGTAVKPLEISVDHGQGTLSLSGKVNLEHAIEIPLRMAIQVFQGAYPSQKVRLRLSKAAGIPEQMDMELSSPKAKDDFIAIFQRLEVKVQDKSSEWMEKSFTRHKLQNSHPSTTPNKRANSEDLLVGATETIADHPKRQKLSTLLQDDDGKTPNQGSSSEQNASLQTSKSPTGREVSDPPRQDSDDRVTIPIKKFNPGSFFGRETRSMRRRTLSSIIQDDEMDESEAQSETMRKTWQNGPLVYPRLGRKKAEVDVHDLDRLRSGEFLNDNLIGLYIRFLEDHLDRTNKAVAKKVYFYNSYFFATLTNGSKGKREINYSGVEKWTRNVDIFSYDYIVVPINESAHWYVAIICNLPVLQSHSERDREALDDQTARKGQILGANESLSDADDEVPPVPETPEAVEATENDVERDRDLKISHSAHEVARQRLASMSLAEGADDDHERGEEESPVSSPANISTIREAHDAEEQNQANETGAQEMTSAGKSRKGKKQARNLVTYDIHQPIIISFDSLDLSRFSTIKILRAYLYEETKSKRGIEIDTSLIKGMKAHGIPLQPNYSDCGLYLLAYVEKFVQDPEGFIGKMLRREMDMDRDWPPLKSGLLRRRLRNFLDDLYEEQQRLSRKELNEEETMAAQKRISFLLGSDDCGSAKDDEQDILNENRNEAQTAGDDNHVPLTEADTRPSQERSRGSNPTHDSQSDHAVRTSVKDIKDCRPLDETPDEVGNGKDGHQNNQEVVEVPDSQDAEPRNNNSQGTRRRRKLSIEEKS